MKNGQNGLNHAAPHWNVAKNDDSIERDQSVHVNYSIREKQQQNSPRYQGQQRRQRRPIVENFRMAASLPGVYRCGSTDNLRFSQALNKKNENNSATSYNILSPYSLAEAVILDQSSLIIDLRSESERNEEKAQFWIEKSATATNGNQNDTFTIVDERDAWENALVRSKKVILRLDVLSRDKLMNYIEQFWMKDATKSENKPLVATNYNAVERKENRVQLSNDDDSSNNYIAILNKRGLCGLYEAILQTGKQKLSIALRAITLNLEQKKGNVVVHCAQGKDRTGILIMLIQDTIGLPMSKIKEDYYMSDKYMLEHHLTSLSRVPKEGTLDHRIFHRAPIYCIEHAMYFLGKEYGSGTEGYLDNIGFDQSWRNRLRAQFDNVKVDCNALNNRTSNL